MGNVMQQTLPMQSQPQNQSQSKAKVSTMGLKSRKFSAVNGQMIAPQMQQQLLQQQQQQQAARNASSSQKVYPKRFSMAATAELSEIERQRELRKQQLRNQQRRDMVEARKVIEEQNNSAGYTQPIRPPPKHPQNTVAGHRSSANSSELLSDDQKSVENEVPLRASSARLSNSKGSDGMRGGGKRKPKKKITYKLNGERFVIYDYYTPKKILGKGAYAVVM